MKNKKNKIVLLVVLIVLVVAGAAVYAAVQQKPDAQALYREAIKNAVSTKAEEPYGSLNIDTEDIELSGEFKGLVTGENGSGKFEFTADTSFDGVPVSLSAEMISLTENEKDDTYFRYRSISTSEAQYAELLDEYFKPVIDVWAKSPDSEDEEEDVTSFEEDGPLAIIALMGLYAPITSVNDQDQKTYLELADKYNLYKVDKIIEDSKFGGVDSRKLKVSIEKNALLAFEREAVEKLSDEADYEQLSEDFVDHAFGENGILTAEVYLSPDEAVITGVKIVARLSEDIKEATFETSMREITSSLQIDYDRDFKVDVPADALSNEEFSQLLAQ